MITIKIKTDYSDEDIAKELKKQRSNIRPEDFIIIKKSLDARNKNNIHWLISLEEKKKLESNDLENKLIIPKCKKTSTINVVGSGPAGYFAAFVLAKAGLKVSVFERGKKVEDRKFSINSFESSNNFDPNANYSFGEGGAGTFSDGKLTSRTKSISAEKKFIFQTYYELGAPEEILYLAHPHIGSDNLFTITGNFRNKLIDLGVEIHFESEVTDIIVNNHKIEGIITNEGTFKSDYTIFATGHSAFETYRMLIKNGLQINTKNFAIGFRVEHEQELINKAQWGKYKLPGVKAAEYRLTSQSDNNHPVYTFCMCPGGKVVQSTPYSNANIVNGMSNFNRGGNFANSAVVAGINPNKLFNNNLGTIDLLNWLENIENAVKNNFKDFVVPFSKISDFYKDSLSIGQISTSYSHGTEGALLSKYVPKTVYSAIKSGLSDFNKKLRGFNEGILLGLETKTSSPVQVERDRETFKTTIENLYFAGEGSGWAGGITSSAADGIKNAMAVINLLMC